MLPRAHFAFSAILVAVFQIIVIDPAISDALIGVGDVIADALSRHATETVFSIATIVIQPLAVKTKDAWAMLGCSNAHGYTLIKKGEVDSYLEGRSRIVLDPLCCPLSNA
jgi:hypothetical protein